MASCKAGTQLCTQTKTWSACLGESLPTDEVCDGKDNDCNGKVDDQVKELGSRCLDPSVQGECQSGTYSSCDAGQLKCTSNTKPQNEICDDGKDNDCDGQVDEAPPCTCTPGMTRECGSDEGECKKGTQTCKADMTWSSCVGQTAPSAELCDGKDNNCDGQVDEGFANVGQACTDGVGGCQSAGKYICSDDKSKVLCDAKRGSPSVEKCNGVDDDCDGKTDEGFENIGKPCSAGQGPCQRTGKYVCSSDKLKLLCDAVAGQPKAEVCNGKDDDCDGKVDNVPGSLDSLSQSCYTGTHGTAGIGECRAGKQSCINGKWETACKGEVVPQAKDSCGGKDDDCNGVPDEGCSCNNNAVRTCSNNTGECQSGSQTCKAGKWQSCTGRGPTQEVCDGKDNDCDGQTDEDFQDVGKACSDGVGGCKRIGVIACSADKKSASCNAQAGSAQVEVCNGQDDDCDGQTDEGINPTPCKTGAQGLCGDGTLECLGGVARCNTSYTARQEICRNGKDDDCDGQTDEICGPLFNYIAVSSTGTSTANRGLTSTRKGTGTYTLTSTSTQNCSNTPLFLTPQSLYMRQMSYTCVGSNYEVHISAEVKAELKSSLQAADGAFYAIQPEAGDTWARVSNNCPGNTCQILQKHGNITRVNRYAKGYYTIQSSLCSASFRPIYVTALRSSPHAIINTYIFNNACIIETKNSRGEATDGYPFVVWLPNIQKVLFATMQGNSAGTSVQILASNDFGDQFFRWKSSYKTYPKATCPPTYNATCPRYKIENVPWSSSSIAIVGVRNDRRATTSFTLDGGDLIAAPLLYQGTGRQGGPYWGAPSYTTRFNILFVH